MPAEAPAPPATDPPHPVPRPQERERLERLIDDYLAATPLTPPLGRDELALHAGTLAVRHALPERWLPVLMIMLSNAAWAPTLAAVPFARRTLLLPPCMRATPGCPASFDEFGLLCHRCGQCSIGALAEEADELGYAVLVAEGTSVVTALVRQGVIDGVIGVGCLASLERAFPTMDAAAVPALAIPLLEDGCTATAVDLAWVRAELARRAAPVGPGRMVDLKALRTEVNGWFEEADLARRLGLGTEESERLALAWLAKAGKRWRPLLAVSVYQALAPAGPLPEAVRTLAIALECIHKASLVYDDIQDGDDCRYGEPTLHALHGTPVAMTVSLLLLGHGYRMIAESGLPAEQVNALLALATRGHCELCLGQGEEVWWMGHPGPLTAEAVLAIFRRKTAPSFEVVFRFGALLAGASDEVHRALRTYSEAIGTAYQVQDDLKDFELGGDVDDIRAMRPTIVLGLAHDRADAAGRALIAKVWRREVDAAAAAGIRRLVDELGVLAAARAVIEDHRRRALAALAPLPQVPLKILLHRLAHRLFAAEPAPAERA